MTQDQIDAEQPDVNELLKDLDQLEAQLDAEQKRLGKMALGGLNGGAALQQVTMSVMPLVTDVVRALRALGEVVSEHDTEIEQLAVGDGPAPITPDELSVLRQVCLALKTLSGELLEGRVPTGPDAAAQLHELGKLADNGLGILDDLEAEGLEGDDEEDEEPEESTEPEA